MASERTCRVAPSHPMNPCHGEQKNGHQEDKCSIWRLLLNGLGSQVESKRSRAEASDSGSKQRVGKDNSCKILGATKPLTQAQPDCPVALAGTMESTGKTQVRAEVATAIGREASAIDRRGDGA
ncbi:hypothetical protein BP6252_09523 [Coleophoma cylindrospora]|uniref:Uncharacterized protein n=1 Tax=Coleophoma cylindrospora TaxID=1849047 RepID=A0A3D8R272_9HELO|nr:hypothetical protein BP6252_09523 [Coleophoma cylindrospora]